MRWVTREHGRRIVGGSERENREISPDVVRGWIRQDYVFEPAGRDLIIVGGVTPGTNAGRRIIEEVGVVQVPRV